MADCTKRILDLSPLDAIECFFQADAWQVMLGRSGRARSSLARPIVLLEPTG